MRFAAAIATAALLLAACPANAAVPEEDPELAPSLHCVQPVATTQVENVMEAQWSPDGHTLALVWFAHVPSTKDPHGYREVEVADTLDVRTGRLWPIGVGDEVDWSGTGAYISYWGPNADELRVVHDDRIVARLAPTIPRVRWVGDRLIFVEKNTIREWRDGAVETVSLIAQKYVPHYPRDDVYFSGDGTQFTLTRYSQDGTLERYLGTTATGDLVPLDTGDARFIEWAPAGHTLLVRDVDRIELRDPESGTKTISGDATRAVHEWAPDGRTLLLGTVSPTMPGGDTFDAFRVWDAPAGAPIATLPNVLGARAFSPDGKFFVGVSRTGAHTTRLEVYRCGGVPSMARPAPDAAERVARIDAGPGRFVRPTAGEISQFLQGSHTGIDLATPFGSLITADDDGVVSYVEWVNVGGNRVCVQHRGALESCVYHTSLPLVRVGDRVARGQPVALIGMTGVTTGPHTHWEVKLAGRIVDPLTF